MKNNHSEVTHNSNISVKIFHHSKFILNILTLILFCLFITLNSSAQIKKSKQINRIKVIKEQTSFSSEGKIDRNIKLSKNVLAKLSRYENGYLKECQSGDWREKNIANHFAASQININGDNQPDLIVQAQTLCFMGAHNTTFWIFKVVGQRLLPDYKMVFDIRCDFLEVLKTTTNGYRDIETASHTAVELYTTKWRFNGQKYQPRECKVTDLENQKDRKVKCE